MPYCHDCHIDIMPYNVHIDDAFEVCDILVTYCFSYRPNTFYKSDISAFHGIKIFVSSSSREVKCVLCHCKTNSVHLKKLPVSYLESLF